MAQGKVRNALRYLSRDESGGVLGLDDIIPKSQGLTTRDVLRDKHPPGKPPCPDSLLPDACESINPIVWMWSAYFVLLCIPREQPASLVWMHLLGEECAPLSSLPLMTYAMPLLVRL